MDQRKSRLVAGLVLIVLGLLFFWLEQIQNVGQSVIFFVVGSLFLGAYLYAKSYGLLIPACLLLGLGTGTLLDDGDIVQEPWQIGLGFGFLGIWLIALLYERKSHWWPLIPGGILLVSAFSLGEQMMEFLFSGGWPLILVAIGVVIVISTFTKNTE